MLENFPLEVDVDAPPHPNPAIALEAFPAETNVARTAPPRTESVPKHSPWRLTRTHALSVVSTLIAGGILSLWLLNQGAPVAQIVTAPATAQPATPEPAAQPATPEPAAQPPTPEIVQSFSPDPASVTTLDPGPASVTRMNPSVAREMSRAALDQVRVRDRGEEPSRTQPPSTGSKAAVEARSSLPMQTPLPPPPVAPAKPPVPESAAPTAVVASRPVLGLDSPSMTPVTEPEPERAPVRANMDPLLYERAAVRDLLEQYRTAYERLDARAAKRVWPGADERALERAFSGLERQTVNFDACDIDITNARGRALCRGSATYTPRVGKRDERTQGRNWTFVILKAGSDWRIESVQAQ